MFYTVKKVALQNKMTPKILSFVILPFVIFFIFITFSFSKVYAYTCISTTREPNNSWGRYLNLGNLDFRDFESEKPEVPNSSYRKSPDCYEYSLYVGERTKSNGEKVPAVEELEIFFNKVFIDTFVIQAHDFNDTVGLGLDLKLNGQKIESKLISYDLATIDGCGTSKYDPDRRWRNGCYKTYTINIDKEITSIRFKPGGNDGEAAAIRLIKISSPIPNLPPVCTNLSKSPNKDFYLPSELITLTASATDPENKNLTYNNWWIDPARNGAFASSTSSASVSFRTNPNSNITENVIFNVSDGVNASQCSYPISTKLLYTCDTNAVSCIPSSTQGVTGIDACNTNCKKTYNCDVNLGCVPVLNTGQFTSQASCEASCKNKYVECASINASNVGNNNFTINANLKSYSYGKVAVVKWVNSTNNVVIKSENINLPASYYEFSKNISYNLPQAGNTDIKILVDEKEICKTTVNSNFSVNLGLNFVDELGNLSSNNVVSVNTEKTTNLKLEYDIAGGVIDSYYLTLTCPNILCKFDNNLTTKTVTNLQGVGVILLPVKFTGLIEGNFNIQANGIDLAGSNSKQAQTAVTVLSEPKLNLSVYKSNRVLQLGNNVTDFCNDTSASISAPSKAIFNLSNSVSGENIDLEYPGTNFPKNISISSYILSKNLLNNLTDFEIKCMKYTINYSNGSSSSTIAPLVSSIAFDLKPVNSLSVKTVNFSVILGPATDTSWFNAVGGSSFAALSVKNSVPSDSSSFFLSNNLSPKISAGISVQNEFTGANTLNISELSFINYSSSSAKSNFFVLKNLLNDFEKIKNSANYINNLSEISFSGEPKLYIIDKDLTIDKNSIIELNSKYSSNKSPQLLLVKGDITINIDADSLNSSTVPLLLISLKNSNGVSVNYEDTLTFPKSYFIGGIFSRKNINFFPTQRLLSNNLPTEKIYFAPQIFLGKDSSLNALKEIRIIISSID